MRCLTGRLNIAILRFAGRAGRRAFQLGVVHLWEKEDMPLVLAVLIIVVTTFRHEGSHALATLIEGVELIEVRLFPGYREVSFSDTLFAAMEVPGLLMLPRFWSPPPG